MTTIEDLPDEVMEILFSYLSFADRNNVRLVNKHWFDLVDCVNLAKDEVLVFRNLLMVSTCAIIRRRHINLRIENIGLRDMPLTPTFWESNGSGIKSLELFRVNLRSIELYEIIKLCPNLEHLSLSCYEYSEDDAPSSSLVPFIKPERLLSLHLTSFKKITGAEVFGLTKFLTKLERFGILLIYGNCYDKYVKETIFSFIERQAGTLKELCFVNCSFVNGEFLNNIPDNLKLQLTGLLLSSCALVAEDFYKIKDEFPNLEKLDLSDNKFLTKDCVFAPVLSLANLKLLSLRGTCLSDNDLSAVAQLEHLRGLDLTRCRRLTDKGIVEALSQNQLPKLTDLRLVQLSCLTDNVLTLILPQLPNLKCLFVENCPVTDRGVSAIFKNCKLLTSLSLEKLPRVTLDSSVSINDLKGLKHLNLQDCYNLDGETLSKLKFFELQTINFRHVRSVSVEHVKSLVVNCPSLRCINLLLYEDFRTEISNCLISSYGGNSLNIAFFKNIFGHFL